MTKATQETKELYPKTRAESGDNIDAVNDALKEGAEDIMSAITQAQNMAICDFLVEVDGIIEEYISGADDE